MKWILLSGVALVILSSCSKNDPVEPAVVPVTPPADTLIGWTKYNGGVDNSLWSISFVNPAKGFVLTEYEMRRTLDSGKTWSHLLAYSWASLFTMNFLNQQYGFAIGVSFAFTTNGGDSWTFRSIPSQSYDVRFINPDTGYYVGPQGLYRTLNTGSSWTNIFPGNWTAIHFENSSDGWAGRDSALYNTSDGGQTWTVQKSNLPSLISMIDFHGQFGMAAGPGLIMKTNDGANWTMIPIFFQAHYVDVQLLSPTLAYVTAGNSVFKTTDGGSTWVREVKLGTEKLYEQHFVDSLHGWAAGTRGTVVRYVKN